MSHVWSIMIKIIMSILLGLLAGISSTLYADIWVTPAYPAYQPSPVVVNCSNAMQEGYNRGYHDGFNAGANTRPGALQ